MGGLPSWVPAQAPCLVMYLDASILTPLLLAVGASVLISAVCSIIDDFMPPKTDYSFKIYKCIAVGAGLIGFY